MDASRMPQWALEGDAEGPELPVWCGFPIPGKAIVCLPMAAVSLIRAASTDLSQEMEESEKEINATFANEPLGDSIANQLVETLRTNRVDAIRIQGGRGTTSEHQTAAPSSNTLLETEIVDLRLSFVPTKGPPHFQLDMTIRSRLRRQSDGVELASHSVTYQSPTRSLAAWTDDDAEAFRAELHTGAKRAATGLVDFLVLEYPAYLEPLMPQNGVEVRSLEPILGWNSAFYGDQVNEDVLSRMEGYTFDLRVSRRGAIVYERSGLAKALHKVEDPLSSCTDHDWRVKARFVLDGRIRASRWSPLRTFKTPC